MNKADKLFAKLDDSYERYLLTYGADGDLIKNLNKLIRYRLGPFSTNGLYPAVNKSYITYIDILDGKKGRYRVYFSDDPDDYQILSYPIVASAFYCRGMNERD